MKSVSILWLVIGLLAATVVWSTLSWWHAADSLAAARALDERASSIITEVRHLRSLPAIVEETPTRQEAVFGMVSDSLVQAGINPSAIRDVRSDSHAGTQQGYRRQSIRVQLDAVSVADVGRFLSTWSTRHPTWITTSLNLAPLQRAANAKADAQAPKWSASIEFSSTYLESPASIPSSDPYRQASERPTP